MSRTRESDLEKQGLVFKLGSKVTGVNASAATLKASVEPVKGGGQVLGLEFLGEEPPSGFLEKPWAIFNLKNWKGAERRRETRIEKPEIVRIEYLNDEMRAVGDDTVLTENYSRGGMRVRLQEPPPEFFIIRVYGPGNAEPRIAVVRNRYLGTDNCERLCLSYVDPHTTMGE